jgi:hypothetical protein
MWHSLNNAADNAFKGLMDAVRRFLGWIGMQGMGIPAEPPTPFMQRPWFRHRYQDAMPSTTKWPWEHMNPDDYPFHHGHPWFRLPRKRPEVEPWQPPLLLTPGEGEQRAGFSPYQRQPIFVIPTSGAQSNNYATPWEPKGGGGGAVQINNVIYLDGQAVANAVHQYSMADMQYPRQAPAFDGRAGYTPPDQEITI